MDNKAKEIRASGLKATTPRVKILEIFQHAEKRHMSAEDVYRLLMSEHSDIGLATVYRVLTQFEQAGILSRHHFGSTTAVFELREEEHHDHLICLDCGHVEEFCDPEIEKRQRAIAKARGYVIADHALSLFAHCKTPDCPHRAEAEAANEHEM